MKHGTRHADPSVIWQSGATSTNTFGIDPRYCDSGFFGRAAYFAYDTVYSDGYSHRLPSGERQMLLVWVTAGRVEDRSVRPRDNARDRVLRHPQPTFHSIKGRVTEPPNRQDAIMIYELHQSYPAYLVTYRPPAN